MAWSRALVAILMLSVATTAASAQSPPRIDVSGWTIYRNESMGFETRHPGHWGVTSATGTPPENVLMGEPVQAGKERVFIQFWVQRNMNTQGVPIAQWYGDQMKRMPPESVKGITTTHAVIGGRPAVHRTRIGTLGRSTDYFVALNKSDVFQISILRPAAETQLDATLDTLLSTVTFIR
jgi:hypothetical protein